jgi:hypothetical protein
MEELTPEEQERFDKVAQEDREEQARRDRDWNKEIWEDEE